MHVGVDVGGTFTDIAVNLGGGREFILHKVASTPEAPELAIIAGLSRILADSELAPERIERVAHGTTVGTNALIQRKCGKVAVLTSAGFRDLLEIGRQTRPNVYDIHSDHPPPLVERADRHEVPQRTLADGSTLTPLDKDAVVEAAAELAAASVDCVIVCFLHSYAFPDDENRAAEILRRNLPSKIAILTSSSVYPEFREYERFSTAVLNGALLTVVSSYLDRLISGVEKLGIPSEIKIGQSSGGLMSVRMAREFPVRACLSGPAAGVQGAARRAANESNLITMDVGGTSADVSLLLGGKPTEVSERELAGFPIRLPALDVVAVGAGGGSIARRGRDGLLKVGPQSAGAVPGPACYGLGGKNPTLTDANVVLGRLNDRALLAGRMPIESKLAEEAIRSIAQALRATIEETALGIVQVACATMVKAIRSVSIERGHDPREFALFAYGGAGPLHATDVARDLGIRKVILPLNPGILCAEGVLGASLASDFVATLFTELEPSSISTLRSAISSLEAQSESWFQQEQIQKRARSRTWTVGARYFGQNYEIALPFDPLLGDLDLAERIHSDFQAAHDANYGFSSPAEPVQLVNVAVKAVAAQDLPPLPAKRKGDAPEPMEVRRTLFDRSGFVSTPVFDRAEIGAGQRLAGPAIIEQMDATVPVFPGSTCICDEQGSLNLEIAE